MKKLVDEAWDWQVCKLTETEFSVVFPSRATLRLATASGKLFLPFSEKNTEIREAFLAPKPSLVLPSAWIRLTGVPEDLMTKERLMAAFVMIGRPIDVDELSIMKRDREPIRMRFQGRYPERITGSIQLFVNGEGYNIGLQVEAAPRGAAGGAGAPPPPPPRDDGDDYDSDYISSDGEWNKHGRRKKKDDSGVATKESEKDKSGAAGPVSSKAAGSNSAPPASRTRDELLEEDVQPIDQYGSNLGLGFRAASREDVESSPLEESMQGATEPLGVVVMDHAEPSLSAETDSQVTDPLASWVAESPSIDEPPLKITRLGAALDIQEGAAASEEATEGSVVKLVTDAGAVEMVRSGRLEAGGHDLRAEALANLPLAQGRRSLAVTISTRKKKKLVVPTPVRKSGRNQGAAAGTPIMELAQRLAAEKNLETNKAKPKGNTSSALDILSDSHITSVVRDSCLLFHPRVGAPSEAISLIRAKEKVQEALAATRRRLELEEEARAAAREAAMPAELVPTGGSPLVPASANATGAADGSGEPRSGQATAVSAEGVETCPPSGRPIHNCVKGRRPQLNVRLGRTKKTSSK
nr:uncharacterized protein LOC127328996 [Lolium perenne]